MAMLYERHFRYNAASRQGWANTVRRFDTMRFVEDRKADEIVLSGEGWKRTDRGYAQSASPKDSLKLKFVGTRVDLVLPPGRGGATIRIDGKRPSELGLFHGTKPWARTREHYGYLPNDLMAYHLGPNAQEETWTLTCTQASPDKVHVRFKLTGSKTGPDGEGENDRDFVSKSGRITILADDWGTTVRGRKRTTEPQVLKPLARQAQLVWHVMPDGMDTVHGDPTWRESKDYYVGQPYSYVTIGRRTALRPARTDACAAGREGQRAASDHGHRRPSAAHGSRRLRSNSPVMKGIVQMQVSKCFLANTLLIALCVSSGGLAAAQPSPDAASQGPRIGSWGDQGDGTYRNPILNADYPDVDVEQVGDTYYMISSKQHMAPGMVILESKDMVNWQTIGHVWNKLSWDPRYNWDRMDGYSYGVWAGDLAYHDGRWYCYQIDNVVGLYMSSAPDIRGPWTEPHLMLANKGRSPSDPAVYWDDKARQAISFAAPTGWATKMIIKLFKMSWDGRELLDEGVEIHRFAGAEAAKIYRIDGKWYIFISQWYVPDPVRPADPKAYPGDRKQIVLRSKTDSIYGPYEQKIVLQRGNGVIRQCSQGALMRAPDGSWWYTHQLVQRAPVSVRRAAADARAGPMDRRMADHRQGRQWRRHRRARAAPSQADSRRRSLPPPTDDDFGSPRLGLQWEWNHNPRDTHWSLTERPGWLRLRASVPVGKGGFWKACNTISQRIMGTGRGDAVAKFDISGMKPGQRAGFVRFGGVYHLLGVQVEPDGAKRLFFEGTGGPAKQGPVLTTDVLWVRTTQRRRTGPVLLLDRRRQVRAVRSHLQDRVRHVDGRPARVLLLERPGRGRPHRRGLLPLSVRRSTWPGKMMTRKHSEVNEQTTA